MSDKIDIEDFSTISQLNPQDRLLVSQAGNGAHGKITVQLVIDAIKRLVSDGVDGKTVSLRKSGGWLEWQNVGDSLWQRLVSLDEIKGYKGDRGEPGQSIKGDKGEPGLPLEFFWRGTELGVRIKGQGEYQYVNLKGTKGDRGDKGDDGKTPKLVSVNASAGESASGSITKSGDDSQGNPEYRINLTLPRGQRGDDGSDGKTPRFEVGTISTLDPSQSATATVRHIGVHMDGSPKYAIDMAIPRGVAGTLGQGDAKDLSVTFSQAGSRSPLSSGAKLSVLFGLVKRWLSDLKEVALSGRFDDLIDKPTTLQGYGITDGAETNHTHSEYAQATHTHPEFERLSGANTVTTLTNLPIDKQLVIATLSSASNITLSSPLSVGQLLHIVIKPTAEISSQPIPWMTDTPSLSIPSGKTAEIDILCVGSGEYRVTTKVM